LLPYSCRRRCFCLSRHQKRTLLFAEHIDEEALGNLPLRQYVVTIAKMLRLRFKYDRKLLGVLRQRFQTSVKMLFQDAADGLVSGDGSFVPIPCPGPVWPMRLFRHKLVRALLRSPIRRADHAAGRFRQRPGVGASAGVRGSG
jgi:hypothetical protein